LLWILGGILEIAFRRPILTWIERDKDISGFARYVYDLPFNRIMLTEQGFLAWGAFLILVGFLFLLI
jgi:hypothetical protein